MARSRKYLDEKFRNSISVFAKAPKESVTQSIDKLKFDLENGDWDRKYGNVRNLNEYNGGYYFLKVIKN